MLNKALMSGNVPGWVLKAYQGVGVPSAALHYDEDRYWVAGYGRDPWEAFHSITRASVKYVQNSAGIYLPIASGAKPLGIGTGILPEQAATNIALWNRDLTNANWTKSNATVARDQVGIDGVTNSASSVLATANNATVTAAAITSASASRTQGWFIQRITGSGAISVSQDGGSTFIAVTTKVGATWYRASSTDFSGLTQTVTNPQLVIKLGTSGDKIAVDFVQLEAGAFCTSPILTTTGSATRAADSITLTGAAQTAVARAQLTIVSKTLWTPAANANVLEGASVSGLTLASSPVGNSPRPIVRNGSTSGARADFNNGEGTAYAAGQVARMGVAFDGVNLPVASNNGTTLAATGTPSEADWSTPVYLGSRNGSSQFWNNYISRIAAFVTVTTQAKLNSIVAGL